MTQQESQDIELAENLSNVAEERPGEVENKADASAPHVSQITLKKGDAFLIVDEYGDFLPGEFEIQHCPFHRPALQIQTKTELPTVCPLREVDSFL